MACAATLYVHGYHNISDAKDAAQALRPLAGDYAYILFAMGLFNASLFAASILPLSTAYTVCEGLGFESGVGKEIRRGAGILLALYQSDHRRRGGNSGAELAAGENFNSFPGRERVAVPPVLIFMLLLVNKKELMGEYVNSRVYNAIAWVTTVVMTVLSLAWFWTLRHGGS